MAEAAVAEPLATRFYCHVCNVEINIPNTDFTCPLCAGGFVEELPPNTPSTSGGHISGFRDMHGPTPPNNLPTVHRLADIRDEIATLLMSRNGQNLEIHSPDVGSRSILTLGPSGSGTSHSGGITVTGGGRVRPQSLDRLDTVLYDFLQSLAGSDSIPIGGNSQMFWMGNLGDYAWGREGIDSIVTQLLNQIETSGPPPLAKDKIAEIPKVEITGEDVQNKLQCSVCWEDFIEKELVRKLPCSHVYHENCIVPWLELHGTCPICRKSMNEEGMDVDEQNDTPGSNNSSSNIPSQSNQPNNLSGNRNASSMFGGGGVGGGVGGGGAPMPNSNNSARGNNRSQNSQNTMNIFGFDDDNVDLD